LFCGAIGMDKKIQEIIELMEGLLTDTTVPKNIRKTLTEARQRLESSEEHNVKVSATIYLIESISDDINMPPHARTQIWAIISALEAVKN